MTIELKTTILHKSICAYVLSPQSILVLVPSEYFSVSSLIGLVCLIIINQVT